MHNTLPQSFSNFFTKVGQVNSRTTSSSSNLNNLYISCYKTNRIIFINKISHILTKCVRHILFITIPKNVILHYTVSLLLNDAFYSIFILIYGSNISVLSCIASLFCKIQTTKVFFFFFIHTRLESLCYCVCGGTNLLFPFLLPLVAVPLNVQVPKNIEA